MSGSPRLSIGLPVYNGERYLADALEALLAQSFSDFELIICDNASTDGTSEIAQGYADVDPRVRYVRLPVNRGSAFSHSLSASLARGEYFKWASDDDLYHPELLQRCVQALDAEPDAVLAHSWTAFIDESADIIDVPVYRLDTAAADPARRFGSLLYLEGGDDIYGVIRTAVFRRFMPYRSHYHADRTFVAALALEGRFIQVPEPLYFRREHEGRSERQGIRGRSIRLDPRRTSRVRHPVIRLLAEYLLEYARIIVGAPISTSDKVRCARLLAGWILQHGNVIGRTRHYQPGPGSIRTRSDRADVHAGIQGRSQ